MGLFRKLFAAGAVAALSACVATSGPGESGDAAQPAAPLPTVRVVDIEVDVPRTLTVSEANLYYPRADIVWREDPYGDRYEQVKAIFETAMAEGTRDLKGDVPVELDIEVKRFHALTEKARYSIGGVHSVVFQMQLRDPKTQEPLTEPKIVEADLDGYGGQAAIDAVARGETQKVRLTRHLAQVIREELTSPTGHKNARLGLLQGLNKI